MHSRVRMIITITVVCFLTFKDVHPCLDRKFSKRCARCDRIICPKMDWIRKATTMYYHLACFLCAVCGRQLSTGECFKLIDGSILCEKHCVDPDLQKGLSIPVHVHFFRFTLCDKGWRIVYGLDAASFKSNTLR